LKREKEKEKKYREIYAKVYNICFSLKLAADIEVLEYFKLFLSILVCKNFSFVKKYALINSHIDF